MAQLHIDIPDQHIDKVRDALEGLFPMDAENFDSPEKLMEFIVRRHLRDLVQTWVGGQAEQGAREEVINSGLIPEPQEE